MKNLLAFLVWCGLSFSAGWFGSQFKPGVWYENLQKPSWTPPSIVFPITWAILYTLMGTASWLVWKRNVENPEVAIALISFIVQLILNALWSWVFFGRHQIGWALFEITTLWVAISATLYFFWRVSPVAGMLMIPYLIWATFAAILNWTIWTKN